MSVARDSKPMKLMGGAVDLFEFHSDVTHWDAIFFLIEHVKTTGREAWGEFNGVMLMAKSDSTNDSMERSYRRRRIVT
jgi:hypothetical protein